MTERRCPERARVTHQPEGQNGHRGYQGPQDNRPDRHHLTNADDGSIHNT